MMAIFIGDDDKVYFELNNIDKIYFDLDKTKIENKKYLNTIVKKFKLLQNYPNPFNPITKINYQVHKTNSQI